jgi:hypothetical protein
MEEWASESKVTDLKVAVGVNKEVSWFLNEEKLTKSR